MATLTDVMSTMNLMGKTVDALKDTVDRIEKTPVYQKGFGRGAPGVTTGALGENSKRFSITKALFHGTNRDGDPSKAKFELDVCNRLKKALESTNSMIPGSSPGGIWLPHNMDFLGERVGDTEDAKYVKAVLDASTAEYDPDEADWLFRRRIVKTQSAYVDSTGGTLIAPPVQGPVIPYVRPQAALLAAGATSRPLPPNGRYVQPRITGAPDVMAVAESQDAPESNLTTDQMVLQAKKVAGMARVTEEATNFSSGTIDTYTQNELNRSLGLKWDAYGFYGVGTTEIPAGLLASTYADSVIYVQTAYPTGTGIGANGNSLLPQYGDYLPSLIEERSFGLESNAGTWIMRPAAYASAVGLRANAVTVNDQAGPMVDITRPFEAPAPNTWRGRKVIKSTNIVGNRTKGTGTNLSDAFFGLWQHCIVATYGAVQFTQGFDGDSFKRGQYLVKGTMWGDIGFEYPTAFLYYGYLLGVQNQI